MLWIVYVLLAFHRCCSRVVSSLLGIHSTPVVDAGGRQHMVLPNFVNYTLAEEHNQQTVLAGGKLINM